MVVALGLLGHNNDGNGVVVQHHLCIGLVVRATHTVVLIPQRCPVGIEHHHVVVHPRNVRIVHPVTAVQPREDQIVPRMVPKTAVRQQHTAIAGAVELDVSEALLVDARGVGCLSGLNPIHFTFRRQLSEHHETVVGGRRSAAQHLNFVPTKRAQGVGMGTGVVVTVVARIGFERHRHSDGTVCSDA